MCDGKHFQQLADIMQTDFNTGEFTDQVAEDVIAEFQRTCMKVVASITYALRSVEADRARGISQIGKQRFEVKMVHVLNALIGNLKQRPLSRTSTAKITWNPYPMNDSEREPQLTQDYLWPVYVSRTYIRWT